MKACATSTALADANVPEYKVPAQCRHHAAINDATAASSKASSACATPRYRQRESTLAVLAAQCIARPGEPLPKLPTVTSAISTGTLNKHSAIR